MSPKEKIAKLEGLLARVKERAEAPRPKGASVFVAPAEPAHPAQSFDGQAHAQSAHQSPTAPPPSVITSPPPTIASMPPGMTSGWSDPPPNTYVDAGAPDIDVIGVEDLDSDMDVEVSSEVVEVDIDIDEPGLMPAESGAQPVADYVAAAELEEVSDELLPADPSAPPPAVALEPPPANEVIEPAPSSSPRPIASEVKEETYEDDSAPRHTPPPESGKQVAAPSVKPEPRRSSSPPPSIEGHTLIGGWREPGMALPRFETTEGPRGPAVRVPPPPPPPPPAVAPPVQAVPSAPPPRAAEPVRLVPEVMKADFPAGANVAAVEGTAPVFAPSTFGELLDATLGL